MANLYYKKQTTALVVYTKGHIIMLIAYKIINGVWATLAKNTPQ